MKNFLCSLILFPIILFLFSSTISAQSTSDWYMAGGNPKRTGWTGANVSGLNGVEWYRPIEAYIDQKVQLIAANGIIYISTSRGLIALDAVSGDLKWRFNTQLPLGHSPSVDTTTNPAVLYVGGLDKKLYSLNATTGQLLWTYDGATAGYDTNPLIAEGKVIIANRDGNVYAVNKQGTSGQGQLSWKFQTGGYIAFSPAYNQVNGVGRVYVVSNDQYAYAIRADNGLQVWKSQKLPGDGFHSYYPVIYRDKIIFSTTYIVGEHPENEFRMRNAGGGVWEPVTPGDPLASGVGGLVGNVEGVTSWSNGFQTLYPWRVLEHYEANPDGDLLFHKPDQRAYIVLNQSDGSEFTFDSDGDGYKEYIPFSFWQAHGSAPPPIVDPSDNLAYGVAPIACCSDAKGKLYGWSLDHPSRLTIVGASATSTSISSNGGWAAMAEPIIYSGGGNFIYKNLCCDRAGQWFSSVAPQSQGDYWSYSLSQQIPGYDFLWQISPVAISRHVGWYAGTYTTGSGIYHSHSFQAPIIPYGGRIYVHRSNVIIAYGNGAARGQLPTIPLVQVSTSSTTPSLNDLSSRLNSEIQKIVDVNGHLRPGWLSATLSNYGDNRYSFEDYFINPGDTLFTLSYAYPHLSSSLQNQVATYLRDRLIPDYFDTNPASTSPTMYAAIGYNDGQSREWANIPSEKFSTFSPMQKTTNLGSWSFQYPQQNFYAMYLYAKNIPSVNITRLYALAKSKIKVPAGVVNENTTFTNDAFQHNAWITGYEGFLKLQELAGMTQTDSSLRTSIVNERDRLINLRATLFNKESPWVNLDSNIANNYKKNLDIARNFMYLSPELAQDFRNNSQLMQKATEAMTMYEYLAPFWFMGKYESFHAESSFQHLYNQIALFQAKAWIFRASREELYKYLDVPMFARGDLFYIQNLVATIEAPSNGGATSTPTPTGPHIPNPPADANGDGLVNGIDYIIWLNHFNQNTSNGSVDGDFDDSGRIDGADYVIWVSNYSIN